MKRMFDVDMPKFEALHDALGGVIDVDPGEMSNGQVHRQLVELLRVRSMLDAVTLRFAEEWEARGLWAEDGSRAADARLSREVKISRSNARKTLRRAKALKSMPATAQALAAGTITIDHVDLLINANAQTRLRSIRFAEDERDLVHTCEEKSFFDADREIRNWCVTVDAILDDDGPEPTWNDRAASWGRGINNDVHLKAILDPVGGAEVAEALERIERELYLEDKRTGADRTNAQRRADAVVEMARCAMAMPANAKKPRPLITVVMGDWMFRRLCELSNGSVVSPGSLAPYVSEADVEGVLFDGPFYGVGVSSQRTFTGVVRKIVEVRDRHCQHPAGCDVPWSKCDVDHIIPHSEGGITRQEDGRLECRPQNRNPVLHSKGPSTVTVYDDDPIRMAPFRTPPPWGELTPYEIECRRRAELS